MRWLLPGLLLAALGCGKSDEPSPPPKVSFAATQPAVAELAVLEQVGRWNLVTTLVEHNPKANTTQTNRSTATTYASLALKGYLLVLETEIHNQPKGYELVVKSFDANDRVNPYRCTWFHDDGLVRGFAGKWHPKQARMDWTPLYLPGATKDTVIQMTDVFTNPGQKQFSYEIREKQKVLASGLFEAKHAGPAPAAAQPAVPASREMQRLGRAGRWVESQTLAEGASVKELQSVSQMRWTRGGKFLINEGVTDPSGKKEYFMWVKTWDSVDGVYRWAYFWQDGRMDYFTGYWNAGKSQITWQTGNANMAVELREVLVKPTERSWTYDVHVDGGVVSSGSGSSKFEGK